MYIPRVVLSQFDHLGVQKAIDRLRQAVSEAIVSATGLVLVSGTDTTPGFLASKLVAGANVLLTVLNPGANEQVEIEVVGLEVPNVAALGAFDASGYKAGTSCFVDTLIQSFTYEPASTLTPDGITVIAATGGGRWIRQQQGTTDWQHQSEWHIDAVGGDDENDGSIGAPLKSWNEFARRLGDPLQVMVDMEVFVHSDLPADDVMNIRVVGPKSLRIMGDLTLVTASTVKTYSVNYAGNQGPTLSITGFDPTGLKGSLLRFPNAVAPGVDAFCWIVDPGAGGVEATFLVSRPYNHDERYDYVTPYAPPVGAPVELVTLHRVDMQVVDVRATFKAVDNALQILRVAVKTYDPTNYQSACFLGSEWGTTSAGTCSFENGPTCEAASWPRFFGCWCDYASAAVANVTYWSGCVLLATEWENADINLYDVIVTSGSHYGDWQGWLDAFVLAQGGFGYYTKTGFNTALFVQSTSWVMNSGKLYGTHDVNTDFVLQFGSILTVPALTDIVMTPAQAVIDGWQYTSARWPRLNPSGNGIRAWYSIGVDAAASKAFSAGIKGALAGTQFALADLTASATETPFIIATSGILKNLRWFTSAARVGNLRVEMLVNGVLTSVATANTTGSSAAYTGNGVQVYAGDRVSFRSVLAAGGTASNVSMVVEVV